MVMINPTPGQPDTPNGAPVPGTPNFSGNLPNIVSGVVGGVVGSVTGLKANTWNIIFNTAFYAALCGVGLYLFMRGLFAIVSEIPGASGAGGYITGTFTEPVKKGISAGRSIGTKAVSFL